MGRNRVLSTFVASQPTLIHTCSGLSSLVLHQSRNPSYYTADFYLYTSSHSPKLFLYHLFLLYLYLYHYALASHLSAIASAIGFCDENHEQDN